MSTLIAGRRRATFALAATLSVAAVTVPAPADAESFVPLRSMFRTCDFTAINNGAAPAQSDAAVSAIIRKNGGTVSAEVHLSEPTSPGTHFNVSLIQAPRPASASCYTPGPGVAVGSLDTDGAGQATTTVQDSIRSGTTGVWVFVQRPNPYSQSPLEYYTSDYVTPI
jgi:hypothetical protein